MNFSVSASYFVIPATRWPPWAQAGIQKKKQTLVGESRLPIKPACR